MRAPPAPSIGRKLAERIVLTDHHWLWPGMKQNGYARVNVSDRTVLLHTVVFEAVFGFPPPKRMYNRCGLSNCLNPAHWQVGLAEATMPPLPVRPVSEEAFLERVALLIERRAEEGAVKCTGCGSILTARERRHRDALVVKGWSTAWAGYCSVCQEMHRQTAENREHDLTQRIIRHVEAGRSLEWIGSQYFGGADQIGKVIERLARAGYTVRLPRGETE